MGLQKYPYSQGSAIKLYGLNAQGVCWELCRRWVAGRLAGTWKVGESIWDEDKGKASFVDLLAEHKQRSTFTEANKSIAKLDHQTSRRRTMGTRKFKGLRSRADVINYVCAVPGAYIFIMTGKGSSGHAMAFDSRGQEELYFFDPNQGEWAFSGDALGAIGQWWSKFWDASTDGDGAYDYKTAFHEGERELVRYDTAI